MRRVVVFLLLAAALAAAGYKVAFMVCDPQNRWEDALAYFYNEPRFYWVAYYNCVYMTPDPYEFSKQDVIIVGGSLGYHDPNLFGNRLADYVDQGGKVVVETGGIVYSPDYDGIGGRWRSDGYSPYYSNSSILLTGELDLIIDEPGHAVFDGVSGLWDSYWRANTILRSDALELAHFPDAGGVAVNAAETVVAVNFQAHDDHWWTGDGFLILANAACWLAAGSAVDETSWGWIKAAF